MALQEKSDGGTMCLTTVTAVCLAPVAPFMVNSHSGKEVSLPFQFRCVTPLGGATICCLLVAPAIGQAGPGLGGAPVWLSTSDLGAQNRSVRRGHAQIFFE